MLPYNPLAIANYFLDKAKSEGKPLIPMKLQKLIYFAHGWHLALYDGKSLLDEQVQAWDYGPVVPSVYHEFKKFGSGRVEQYGTDFDLSKGEIITPRVPLDDKQTLALLDKIWEVYGEYTGIQLSNLTHGQNSAWSWVRNDPENDGMRSVGISNKKIQEEFKAKRAA